MKLGSDKKYIKIAELSGNEVITFRSEGEWTLSTKYTYPDGSPQKQFAIKVEINGEIKDMSLNKTNRIALIEAFGDDTVKWIGKSAKVQKIKALISGKMMDTILLEPLKNDNEVVEDSSEPF